MPTKKLLEVFNPKEKLLLNPSFLLFLFPHVILFDDQNDKIASSMKRRVSIVVHVEGEDLQWHG